MLSKPMRRGALIIICGICLGVAATAAGSAEKPPGQWSFPRVRALVLVNSPESGPAYVDVQISGSLTAEQVKQMIGQAGSIGKWSPGGITVEHQVFKSGPWWEEMTGRKAEPEQETVAHFQAVGLANRATGALAVKEFVRALQRYSPVRVVYKVDKQFPFSGPDDEDFEGFHIAHYQKDGTHTFDAVPGERPVAPAALAAPVKAAPARRFPWLGVTLCVAAVAMAVGAGVWKWRMGKSQHKTTQERGDSSGS